MTESAAPSVELSPTEARALGVLIEKALTTPEQYPLSLNSLTAGCNQKNNRDPVLTLTDDEVFDAVESLRSKGLTVRVDAAGSRVHKYRHNAGDVLRARTGELAILAELMLRGPQTLGELRGRASRMHPMPSLDDAQNMLTALMTRDIPLAKELPPSPGSRAERYTQLLAPTAHPEVAAISTPAAITVPSHSLSDRIAALEAEVASLRSALQKLATSIGEPDPTAPSPT